MSRIKDFIMDELEHGRRPSIPISTASTTETVTKLVAAQQPVRPNVSYWRLCYTVILAAGKVAGKEKLIRNYTDENTRHRVAPIVENKKYYSDGIKSVRDAQSAATEEYFQAFDRLNKSAHEHGLDQVAPKEWLNHLYYKKTRDKYKRRIKRYEEEDHPPIALDKIQV